MIVYVNTIAYAEHVALVKGDLAGGGGPVLVRMHALNVLEDVLGDVSTAKSRELHEAMRMIGNEGRGAVVLIREPCRTSLSDRVRSKIGEDSAPPGPLRDYGVGAQILLDLGIRDMVLLSNTRQTIVSLEGYGLSIIERRPIDLPAKRNEQAG